MRIRRRGRITFAFNYGSDSLDALAPMTGGCVLGAQSVGAHNLSAWKNCFSFIDFNFRARRITSIHFAGRNFFNQVLTR
jgi:hypothetical protein